MTWLVIGAGISGVAAARLLWSKGEVVRISEHSTLSDARCAAILALCPESKRVELRHGGHDPSHLDGINQVVLSPGLATDHPLVVAAKSLQIKIISEIDLALIDFRRRKPQGRIIGITGTNGKSTTCAMFGHILNMIGENVAVGGNFGDPPSAMLAENRIPDWLVLELSSYQLEQSSPVRPDAAVFTSLSLDHLAHHGTMADYLAAKWRLFADMNCEALAVLPEEIWAAAMAAGLTPPKCQVLLVRRVSNNVPASKLPCLILDEGQGTCRLPSGEEIHLPSVGIHSPHDQLNAAFVLACLMSLKSTEPAQLARHFKNFNPLPHRCEFIGLHGGQWPVINDSKSTNVESTLVALAAQPQPVLLIMGGQGKGEPYAPILSAKNKIKAAVTFGATGGEIATALRRGGVEVDEFATLKDALAAFAGILKKHPCGILFSPGCASFDEFRNFEERGNVFRQGVSTFLR